MNNEQFISIQDSVLTIYNIDSTYAGTYTCVVSNGCGSVTSSIATLTVLILPYITQQPLPVSACQSSIANFTSSVIGTNPISFQWEKNGNNIAGATNSTLNIQSVALSDTGSYSYVATNICGSVTSISATLSVSSTAPVIVQQPIGGSQCTGIIIP